MLADQGARRPARLRRRAERLCSPPRRSRGQLGRGNLGHYPLATHSRINTNSAANNSLRRRLCGGVGAADRHRE
jgi:hypothetical protein